MTQSDVRVEVVPATVKPALEALREAAQACNEAGFRLTSHTPLMPPGFLVAMRARWDELAGSFHLLAVDLELTALREAAYLAAIEFAGGQRVDGPFDDLAGDIGRAIRTGRSQLEGEAGLDVLVDRPGQALHATLGAVDMLASTWHTATVLLMGTPAYGVGRPGGRAARHELLSMGINLTRMSPFWVTVEPRDAAATYAETASRAFDLPDLQHGDVFRWAGHVGFGLALTRGASAFEGGFAPAAARAYEEVGRANRVPTERSGGKLKSSAGRRVREVEEDVASFLEKSVP